MPQPVVRIPPTELERLKTEAGHEGTPPQYSHPNFFVREVMWRRLDHLMGLSRATPRDRVLDFGGGNGVLAPTLSKRYREVVSVDLQPEMLRRVVQQNHLKNVTIRQEELSAAALEGSSFDTVVAADVLEHIPDFLPIVQELRRVLKPGGELLVSAPSENLLYAVARLVFGYQKPPDHYHDARTIERRVGSILKPVKREYFPLPLASFSMFSLIRFVRET
jgi:ubiquinone/menaquinone biosynthesis C-methylase UbiE